jgi:hypothetical protein
MYGGIKSSIFQPPFLSNCLPPVNAGKQLKMGPFQFLWAYALTIFLWAIKMSPKTHPVLFIS